MSSIMAPTPIRLSVLLDHQSPSPSHDLAIGGLSRMMDPAAVQRARPHLQVKPEFAFPCHESVQPAFGESFYPPDRGPAEPAESADLSAASPSLSAGVEIPQSFPADYAPRDQDAADVKPEPDQDLNWTQDSHDSKADSDSASLRNCCTRDKKKMKRFRLNHSQTRFLMAQFTRQAHPDAAQRERLAREIPGLTPRQVQVWFQNRRAKLKRLTAEDRDRMIKSRALPDDFDATQALLSQYGSGSQPPGAPSAAAGFFTNPPSDFSPITTCSLPSASDDGRLISPVSAVSTTYAGSYLGASSPQPPQDHHSTTSPETPFSATASFPGERPSSLMPVPETRPVTAAPQLLLPSRTGPANPAFYQPPLPPHYNAIPKPLPPTYPPTSLYTVPYHSTTAGFEMANPTLGVTLSGHQICDDASRLPPFANEQDPYSAMPRPPPPGPTPPVSDPGTISGPPPTATTTTTTTTTGTPSTTSSGATTTNSKLGDQHGMFEYNAVSVSPAFVGDQMASSTPPYFGLSAPVSLGQPYPPPRAAPAGWPTAVAASAPAPASAAMFAAAAPAADVQAAENVSDSFAGRPWGLGEGTLMLQTM